MGGGGKREKGAEVPRSAQLRLEDGVPVIYATGYSSASLPVDPRACILEKPVAAEALDRTLRSVAAC